MPVKPDTACRHLVDAFRNRQTMRAGSLITTVFGDAIAPRGGVVWLGSLIKAMKHFGISERLVRTSVFRLARDGWLQSRQVGRRSYYSLTEEGRERFEIATHRIYRDRDSATWDGRWTLLLLGGLDAEQRDLARREYGWLGFGALSARLLAHPSPDFADLKLTTRRLGVEDAIVQMRGQTMDGDKAMRALVSGAWNLDDIDARYQRFIDMFRDAASALNGSEPVDARTAFVLRTLLIQEYRKVMLRDPELPDELLPADWHGRKARVLCVDLYRRVYEHADRYIDEVMETDTGSLPGNDATFYQRFGGLAT